MAEFRISNIFDGQQDNACPKCCKKIVLYGFNSIEMSLVTSAQIDKY